MLDIKFVRDNPEAVKENIRKKFQNAKLPLVDEVIALDTEKRAAMNEANDLRAQRNQLSKRVGMLMGQAKKDPSKLAEAEEAKAQVKANADRLAQLEEMEGRLTQQITKIMMVIPQMIDPSVPIGPDDSHNVEVQRFGEAKGLRALFMYYLLRAHGGLDANGKLLGVPNDLVPTNVSSDFNSLEVRASYADCMKQLIEDAEEAVRVLPVDYKDTDNETMTVNCLGKSYTVTKATYNRVLGTNFAGRLSGRIARAVLAQATLMAASPAFASGSGVTYEQAAQYAKAVLDLNGGISGIDTNGLEWYADPNMKDLTAAECPKEVLWRTEKSENNDLETKYYPPSIYGQGRINPTQNLVDAFPAANGYPITDAKSEYDPANPYANRDPRLAKYIIYNGQTAGSGNAVINTQADNATNLDGLNKDVSKSTRTGYYMKKLLRQDINLDPTVNGKAYHYTARIRYTELYLDYAEAANEAYGPKGGTGYSAYDVIKAIRERAGLGEFGDDPYLEECAQSKEKMRDLIRNERRIELCFEGFRFWDLRRWKANLTEEAKGMSITNEEAGKKYTPISVETRNFKENAFYGPIPYDQILNFPSLVQNAGW